MLRSLMNYVLALICISVASIVIMVVILKAGDAPLGTAHLPRPEQPKPAADPAASKEGPPGASDVIYAGRNMVRQMFNKRFLQGSVRFEPIPHASYSWKKIDDTRYEACGVAFVRTAKHHEERRPFIARIRWYEPARTWTPYYIQIGPQILIDDSD